MSDLEIFRWRTNPHIAKYMMCGAPGRDKDGAAAGFEILFGKDGPAP